MSRVDLTLIRKALDESDLSALYKDRTIDSLLVELVDFQNPLRQNLRRVPGSGDGYMVRKRTPGSTAAEDVDDTDSFSESTGSYAEVFFTYRTVGAQGKITRRVQKTGKIVADLMAEEMEAKAREVRNQEEFRILWGTNPTPAAKQIIGLNHHMSSNTGQIVALTLNSVGADLTAEKLDEVIDLVITGNPGMLITSRAGKRKINAMLQGAQRFNDKIEVQGGFKLLGYNDIPIFVSTEITDTMQVSSGGTISSLTGGSTTALFVVDLQQAFLSVLTELQTMPLARRSSQFEEFDIFEDLAMVVRDIRGVSMVTGWKGRG